MITFRKIAGKPDLRIGTGKCTSGASAALWRGAAAMLLALALAAPALPSGFSSLPQDQEKQAPPPAAPAPSAPAQQPQESSSKRPDSVVPVPTAQPDYNPLDSEKDVDVGMFYMRKGDVDAAIPRFEDAIRLRANYAKPRLLLGEAYEKKHDNANAVKYYKEYLKVFPDAPDAKKVQSTIEKLSKK
jgi:tetratricopeptide (TPR) repeat protein